MDAANGFLFDRNANQSFSKMRQNTRSEVTRPPLCQDVTKAVGQVPFVRLNRVSPVCEAMHIYAKLESCNPGGSIKEKNAVYLIDEAERSGSLRPGGTIVESSSGNFGIGLAMVGAAKGYRVVVVIDAKTAPPFRRMLKAYGAELVDVPLQFADETGSMQKARMKRAQEIAKEIPGAWYPCQHLNPDNPTAHSVFTGREIADAFGENLDAVVIGVSTAGQIMGIARYLKPRFPRIKIIGVDVEGSVIMGTPGKPYKMTGVGLSFVPPNLNFELLDRAYVVPEHIGYSLCHALARKEGLLLGASTGAIVAGALAAARGMPTGSRILVVSPDRGDRYLETVYDDDWLAKNKFEILNGTELDDAVAALPEIRF